MARASALQTPRGSQTTTLGYIAGATVVVRWLAGAPIEMRIEDATPRVTPVYSRGADG